MIFSDEQLYQQRSYRALYDRYSAPLFRFIYRFTANSETAEELLHDVFSQLLSGKYKPQEDASLKNWLYTLAKNKSLNYIKKSSFEVKSDLIVDLAQDHLNLESQTIQQNLLSRLSLVENKLPLELNQTWKLRKLGLDHQQIAEKLSIPVGTVKSRFHRLVEFLKGEFNNEH